MDGNYPPVNCEIKKNPIEDVIDRIMFGSSLKLRQAINFFTPDDKYYAHIKEMERD